VIIVQTLKQLKSGELRGVKSLTLSEDLFEFPMEILSLADSLELLDLSNNQLSSLPEEFAQLTRLKILFANKNNFVSLPEVLGKCPSLEMIGFKANNMRTVPSRSLPSQLRWLILTENKIVSLPDSLGDCLRLKKLSLAGNLLTELPLTMSKLNNLQLLRISANKLSKFPDQLLDLPKLAWIAFAGNPFCNVGSQEQFESVPVISSKDYRLKKELGKGASGVISKAEWLNNVLNLPNDIAVKVFKGQVTSDGYPQDELQARLKAGSHPRLVNSLAQVKELNNLALVMELIPEDYKNLGLPPSLESCTRDTFPEGFTLSINLISYIVDQMTEVFEHLHDQLVCHGDLYAHNTLFNEQGDIIFGDFGAASMYHMLDDSQKTKVKQIEARALNHFIDDLLGVCAEQDKQSSDYYNLKQGIFKS